MKWRVGERRHDREPREINPRLHSELRRFQKHIWFIIIQAEHETALKRDPMLMQHFNHARKSFRRIKPLMTVPQIFRRNRFQPHQQAFAAAACGQFQQFRIIRQQDSRQSVPLNLKRHQRPKQSRGISTVGDNVQINKMTSLLVNKLMFTKYKYCIFIGQLCDNCVTD